MKKIIVGILIVGLFIGASFVPSISGNLEVNQNVDDSEIYNSCLINPPDEQLDQYQHGCNGVSYAENTLYVKAQSFKPSLSTCTKVVLRILKNSTPDGNVIVSIRKILNGSDLTSVTVDMSLIPERWSYYEFDFPDISVIPEETYYIVFISEFNNWAGVGWCHDIFTSYDRGKAWVWSENTNKWYETGTPDLAIDMWFEEYAQVTNFPSFKIGGINGGFGVSTIIVNNGTAPANNVNWSIDVNADIGLILSGSHTENVIDEIGVNESANIQSNNLRGIGLITINVQVADAVKQATAFLLGPLVLRVNEI